jgi:hypothetical protein
MYKGCYISFKIYDASKRIALSVRHRNAANCQVFNVIEVHNDALTLTHAHTLYCPRTLETECEISLAGQGTRFSVSL